MQLRWGMTGCGLVTADFVGALSLLPAAEHKVEVTAVASSDLERAKAFVESKGCLEATPYGDYQQLYHDPNVDIVYVATLTHQHYRNTMEALGAGKHVLCEKPMGVNAREVREMIDLAREKGLFLMEGYWSRFFPVYERMWKAIADGEIGTVHCVLANFGKAQSDDLPKVQKWIAGGAGGEGATYTFGVYPVQLATSLLGVRDGFKRADFSVSKGYASGVDDAASMTLYYEGGRSASLFWTSRASLQNDATIVGDKGRIRIPELFWCPTRIELASGVVEEFPLPATSRRFNYGHSAGFSYEAAAVRRSLMAGETECLRMSLDESLFIAELLEAGRKQVDMPFPQDR